ncbi:trypsin [Stackebrandtia albiflava]|uniref:Trypsin n=1 Tax=Stackebrandtia albiflava TaxID=406432 RepID=A0A562V256_9ACTN|nr:trypsin-like serine protease [Stackebrandtia albiflava]TWJ11902.1 trypsin [Stackebrandtia albiflava]
MKPFRLWRRLVPVAVIATAALAVGAAPTAHADVTVSQHHGDVGTDIVGGGTVTEPKPWIAALYNNGGFTCTASQIGAQWIITAAHCVEGSGAYSVRIGSLSRSGGGTVVTVSEKHLHPEYAWPNNDIALLRLSQSFPNSYAPMATSADLSTGQASTIYGWGSEQPDWGGTLPDRLKYSDGNTTTQWCDTPGVICMMGDGGVAGGDSGGPGFVASAQTGRYVLAGVCAIGHVPADTRWGGYTSIPHNATWINQVSGL